MKRALILVFFSLVLSGQAQTNQPIAQSTNSFAKPPSSFTEITTLDGKTYRRVKLQRVFPSEIIISYVADNKALEMTNIKLKDLSPVLREAFGYDPKKKQPNMKLNRISADN